MLTRDEETLDILVHYQPLYWNNEGGIYDDGVTAWTRTLKNFTSDVEWKGKTVPRFKLISSAAKA
jgi:hypothetical protein